MRRFLIFLLIVAGNSGLTGQDPTLTTPPEDLIAEANAFIDSLRSNDQLIEDEEVDNYTNEIVGELLSLSEHSQEKFRVCILNSLTVNAMMLPNGTILLTSGLLLKLESKAELAFVIGHELSHYLLGHFRQKKAEREHAAALQNFINEYQADSLGVDLAVAALYPASSAIFAIQKLPLVVHEIKILTLKIKIKQHLTHPPTARRIEQLRRYTGFTETEQPIIDQEYRNVLSSIRNEARWDMLLQAELEGNSTMQIMLIDSLLTLLPQEEDSDYTGYLLLQQSAAIDRLLRMANYNAMLDVRKAQATLTHRNDDLAAERNYFNLNIFDILGNATKRNLAEPFIPILERNINRLAKIDTYQVEALRIKGLYLERKGQYVEARQVFAEYLAEQPTHPSRRFARSLLKSMPKKNSKKPKL